MNESRRLRKFDSIDLHALQRVADAMVQHFGSQLVVGLVGTLGAGKTSLVQAIARAAGIDGADVTSPTFTLLQTHQGSIRIHHLDAYRVADEDEFLELGVDELFDDRQAWTLIEWADRVAAVMPRDTLWITLMVTSDPQRRTLQFEYPAGLMTSAEQLLFDRDASAP